MACVVSDVSEERCDEVDSLVFDIFANLGASEEQLDFPVLYASAKEGWASSTFTKNPPADAKNMSQLLDAINMFPHQQLALMNLSQCWLVSMMEKDDYVGRILTGRITSGVVRINDRVHGLRDSDSGVVKVEDGKVCDPTSFIVKLRKNKGMVSFDVDCAGAGDIITVAGLKSPSIGHTVANVEVPSQKELTHFATHDKNHGYEQ
ncbi:hypothetical protein SSX86_005128 [Deinandra increscens subsp. villosa]|uniref:Uncharacterized protein n=1 Tax=Deinandra increscens subsp. villosa TaxID=3103831 RepID=A0AAP0DT94_9ASTR